MQYTGQLNGSLLTEILDLSATFPHSSPWTQARGMPHPTPLPIPGRSLEYSSLKKWMVLGNDLLILTSGDAPTSPWRVLGCWSIALFFNMKYKSSELPSHCLTLDYAQWKITQKKKSLCRKRHHLETKTNRKAETGGSRDWRKKIFKWCYIHETKTMPYKTVINRLKQKEEKRNINDPVCICWK